MRNQADNPAVPVRSRRGVAKEAGFQKVLPVVGVGEDQEERRSHREAAPNCCHPQAESRNHRGPREAVPSHPSRRLEAFPNHSVMLRENDRTHFPARLGVFPTRPTILRGAVPNLRLPRSPSLVRRQEAVPNCRCRPVSCRARPRRKKGEPTRAPLVRGLL